VLIAEQRAVDVADFARADRLCRSAVEGQSTVGRLVDGSCLVLAVGTQSAKLVELKRSPDITTIIQEL